MTEAMTESATGGKKGKKPQQIHWIDPKALLKVAEVAAMGAEKYGNGYNYRLGYDWSLSFDAAQRHLMQFWSGEDLDPESSLPHLAHAAWHCLTMLSFLEGDYGTDDRFGMPIRNTAQPTHVTTVEDYNALPVGALVESFAEFGAWKKVSLDLFRSVGRSGGDMYVPPEYLVRIGDIRKVLHLPTAILDNPTQKGVRS